MECAQMKELLEPTLEKNDDDNDSKDDGDGGGMCGGEFNEVAVMAAKSTNDNDDYSNDDGNEGSGGSSKCNDDNDDNGGGLVRQGKDCTIPMTMPFWMVYLMMITSRSIFRPFRMSPLAIAIVIESWEDPSLLAQMQWKRRRKATKVNERHLPMPIVASSLLLCPLWT